MPQLHLALSRLDLIAQTAKAPGNGAMARSVPDSALVVRRA